MTGFPATFPRFDGVRAVSSFMVGIPVTLHATLPVFGSSYATHGVWPCAAGTPSPEFRAKTDHEASLGE